MRACLDRWKLELANDEEKEFLLSGIRDGFMLTDVDLIPMSVCCSNYSSASVLNKIQVKKNIIKEINGCRYIVTDQKPAVVSSTQTGLGCQDYSRSVSSVGGSKCLLKR